MKTIVFASLVALSLAGLSGCSKQAPHVHSAAPAVIATADGGQLIAVTEKDAAWTAKAVAEYPTQMCTVSAEKLGSMGAPPQYIYRIAGKPDRLIQFCCSSCLPDFKADPAKFLKQLDESAAQKAAGPKA